MRFTQNNKQIKKDLLRITRAALQRKLYRRRVCFIHLEVMSA